jgi:hypothetical protein
MAIRRCPYCRAIIEEDDQYCKNCGTQLLFPQDEQIEEDIPGDKITHADVAEKEESEEADEEELEEPCGTPSEEDEDKLLAEEKEEEERPEEGDKEEAGKEEEEKEAEQVEEKAETIEEPAKIETSGRAEEVEEETEPKKSRSPQEELTFDTKDLDRMGPTVEQAKEEIDRYLESFKKEKSPPKEEKRAAQEPEIIPSLTGVLETEVLGDGEGLPPWADKIKEPSPPSEILEIQEDERKRTAEQEKGLSGSVEDVEWKKTRVGDSGMGIPEGVTRSLTQTPLPFEGPLARQEKEAVTHGELEEREEIEPTPREPDEAAPALDLSTMLKARLFDLLFVTAIWLISLWLAAQSMTVNLFKLISVTARPSLIFYGILLVAYFFLFLFFLGETLGDRLFSARD